MKIGPISYEELLVKVLNILKKDFVRMLGLKSIINLTKISKNLRKLMKSPDIWKELLTTYFTIDKREGNEEYVNYSAAPKLLFVLKYTETKLAETTKKITKEQQQRDPYAHSPAGH